MPDDRILGGQDGPVLEPAQNADENQGPSQETQIIDLELGQAAKYPESLCDNHQGSLVAMAKVREAKVFFEGKATEMDGKLRTMLENFEDEMLGEARPEEAVNVQALENAVQEALDNINS